MKTYIFLIVLFSILISSCSEKSNKPSSPDSSELSTLIHAIGCSKVDFESKYPLESKDREFYQPISYEIANIRTNKPLDGYHGPTVGKYILAIETYSTKSEAQKRVNEYNDLSRLAKVTKYDENELSKMTVRCWAYCSGQKAYLLTTLGAAQKALEDRTKFIKNGVQAHLSKSNQ